MKWKSKLTDVILACRQELGLLESLCFLRMCNTRTSLGPADATAAFLRFEALSSSSSGSSPGVGVSRSGNSESRSVTGIVVAGKVSVVLVGIVPRKVAVTSSLGSC